MPERKGNKSETAEVENSQGSQLVHTIFHILSWLWSRIIYSVILQTLNKNAEEVGNKPKVQAKEQLPMPEVSLRATLMQTSN